MRILLAATLLSSVAASTASAVVTVSGANGSRAASAAFQVSGSNLIVTLTNTSISDVLAPVDVLTAVFFDIAGNPALTRVSAAVAPGTVHFGSDNGGNVGSEWAYRTNLTTPTGLFRYGISSSGLDLFGPGDRFATGNLQGPPSGSVGGLEYGITSAGDNLLTGNNPVTGKNALIKNSVIFTLSCGGTCGFTDAAISNAVRFQYGTALNEPSIHTPEPGLYGALCVGLSGLYLVARRRRTAV